MNPNLQKIKEHLIGTAAYYGQNLTDAQVKLYAEDLADLPADEVCAALKKLRLDPKNQRFPLPAKVRELLAPNADPEIEAKECAARIVGAIRTFGWCNTEDARKHIGELGWGIVESLGGWQHLCENTLTEQIPMYHAQWRELAKSRILRKQAGIAELPQGATMGFGERDREALPTHIGQVLVGND